MEENKKNKIPNVPNLRFSDDTWKIAKIGDVLTIERGGSPRPIQNFVTRRPDGINWIKIGDTSDDGYIYSAKEKIIPEGVKHSRKVKAGDLLLSNSMSFGKPYILKINGCIHDGWLVIRDMDNKFSKEFLRNYLGSSFCISQYKKLAAGGVVTNLNKDLVCSAIIKYPPMTSQEKIASFLCALDERIRTQNKIIEELQSLRKAIYYEQIKGAKKEEMMISDICDIGRGRVISQQEIAKQNNPIYPVFSSQTLNNGIMGYLDNYDFDGEYVTWTTDGANAGTVFYHNGKFNCTNVCGTLKTNSEKVIPYYLFLALSHEAKRYVSTNLGNPKLMNGTMAKIKIKVPSIVVQKTVVNGSMILDRLIDIETKILNALSSQKSYFLANLFI